MQRYRIKELIKLGNESNSTQHAHLIQSIRDLHCLTNELMGPVGVFISSSLFMHSYMKNGINSEPFWTTPSLNFTANRSKCKLKSENNTKRPLNFRSKKINLDEVFHRQNNTASSKIIFSVKNWKQRSTSIIAKRPIKSVKSTSFSVPSFAHKPFSRNHLTNNNTFPCYCIDFIL